jgi:protein SCO1
MGSGRRAAQFSAIIGLVLAVLALALLMSDRAPTSDRGSGPANPGREYFTDTILLDQNGAHHRFYSDLIAGRTVIINIVFTSCRSSCPLTLGKLAELQDLFGDRMGEIVFLSISVDPVMDTPQMLRVYADALNARPGWYFLTGPADAVYNVLRRLGDRSNNPEEHSDVIIVGNDPSGAWIKLTAIATTEDIAEAVIEVEKGKI